MYDGKKKFDTLRCRRSQGKKRPARVGPKAGSRA